MRSCLLLLSVFVATTCTGGCRSCSTCHDYDPPVANCHCDSCGTHSAGSASAEFVDPDYSEEGYPPPAYEESPEEYVPPPRNRSSMNQPRGVR